MVGEMKFTVTASQPYRMDVRIGRRSGSRNAGHFGPTVGLNSSQKTKARRAVPLHGGSDRRALLQNTVWWEIGLRGLS